MGGLEPILRYPDGFTWSVSAEEACVERLPEVATSRTSCRCRRPTLNCLWLASCRWRVLGVLLPALPSIDVPRFADLGVPEPMARALATRAITTPTPIQAATIPDALDGRDVCGKAPTGSGKTLAFGIPLVLGVAKAKPKRPRGLVLAPTRELAAQISKELQLLAKPKGPWVEAFYGGVGFDRQLKALAPRRRHRGGLPRPPGRSRESEHIDLRDVDFVVIDEADRMADMGFLPEVRRILDPCSDRSPDAAVLGHARRRRRRADQALPDASRLATSSRPTSPMAT